MNVKKPIQTKKLVEEILIEYPEARNDDNFLWWKVIEIISDGNKDIYIRVIPFREVLLNLHTLGLPSFETVSRARRKVQEKNPSLRGDETVQNHRREKEQVYRDFSRL